MFPRSIALEFSPPVASARPLSYLKASFSERRQVRLPSQDGSTTCFDQGFDMPLLIARAIDADV